MRSRNGDGGLACSWPDELLVQARVALGQKYRLEVGMMLERSVMRRACGVFLGAVLGACGSSGGNNPGADGGTTTGDSAATQGNDASTGRPGIWQPVNIGASANFSGLWGTSASSIYAVGPQTIQYYNGSSWASGGTTPYTLQGVGGGATTGFAVGITVPPNGSGATGMGVLLELMGTTMPNQVTDPTPTAQPTVAWGRADNDIWVVGGDTVLHWNGSSWSDLSSMGIMQGTVSDPASDLHAVWGSSANDVHLAGKLAYHWNGSVFTQELQNPGDTYYGAWGSSANDVWLVGSGVARHYNGTTWSNGGVNGTLRAVWGTAANNIWAVGDTGILHYDGTNWIRLEFFAAHTLRAIWGTGAGNIWAVGDAGICLHWTQ